MTKNAMIGKYGSPLTWIATMLFGMGLQIASVECLNHWCGETLPASQFETCPYLPNCESCPNKTVCEQCIDLNGYYGYYGFLPDRVGCMDCNAVSNGTCKLCVYLTRCLTCTSSSLGPVENTDSAACAACGEFCATCKYNGASKCDRCKSGYYVDPDYLTCYPCGSNCYTCNQNLGQCDPGNCHDGYTFQSGSNTCIPTPCLMPDCLNATCVPGSPNICTKCRPGFGTLSPTIQTGCFQCNAKYGCLQCTTLTQCTTCNTTALTPKKDGSGECAPCAVNCVLCPSNGPGKCDRCKTGYTMQSDQTCK